MDSIKDYIEACKINDQDPNDLAQERYNNMGADVTVDGIWLPGSPGAWVSDEGEFEFLAWVKQQA